MFPSGCDTCQQCWRWAQSSSIDYWSQWTSLIMILTFRYFLFPHQILSVVFLAANRHKPLPVWSHVPQNSHLMFDTVWLWCVVDHNNEDSLWHYVKKLAANSTPSLFLSPFAVFEPLCVFVCVCRLLMRRAEGGWTGSHSCVSLEHAQSFIPHMKTGSL